MFNENPDSVLEFGAKRYLNGGYDHLGNRQGHFYLAGEWTFLFSVDRWRNTCWLICSIICLN
ncbi:hypothetical protein NTG1052_390018 [Candidatus Nitrotoga sp. 1052]|nr:hypothetical protein NTG1052_390018 [Candidatus Nitrotoga sp. 1052]